MKRYRNLFIVIGLLLLAIGGVYSFLKTPLDAKETVAVYVMSGLQRDASPAQGTTIQNEVEDMVKQIRESEKRKFDTSLGAAVLSEPEYNQLDACMHRIGVKARVQTQYLSQNDNTAVIGVVVQPIDKNEINRYVDNKIKGQALQMAGTAIGSLLGDNSGMQAAIRKIVPTYIDAYKEASQTISKYDKPYQFKVTCIYNEDTKKWEIANMNALVSWL